MKVNRKARLCCYTSNAHQYFYYDLADGFTLVCYAYQGVDIKAWRFIPGIPPWAIKDTWPSFVDRLFFDADRKAGWRKHRASFCPPLTEVMKQEGFTNEEYLDFLTSAQTIFGKMAKKRK